MAYTARRDAVRKLLDDTAKVSRETFGKAHKEDLEEKVRGRLERYFSDRERTLDAGVKLLENPLPPKDHQERWKKHFGDFGSAQAKEIAELVKDSKLIRTPFVSAVKAVAGQESAFFAAVAGMPLPSCQGRILQWYGQFAREQKALRDDWKELKGDGGELSEEMREVMREIREAYDEAVKKAARVARDVGEALRRWVPVAEKLEDAASAMEPGPLSSGLQAIGHGLQVFSNLRPSVETLESRFRALYKSEETVSVILLGGTRERVEEFLDDVNLEAAVDDFEASSRLCVEAAQKLAPPGQRDDAEDLVDAMMNEVNETLADFEDFFEDFVDEFREIFIGPVGDRTVRDLVGKELAVRESDSFQRLNVQSELRKIHDGARDWFGVPLGGLHPDVRARLMEWMERDLERLAIATREASDFTQGERIRFVYTLAWNLLADGVKRLPGKVL